VAQTETESGWKVMVVDSISVRIISAACRMFDITDEGVTIVSNQPFHPLPSSLLFPLSSFLPPSLVFPSPLFAGLAAKGKELNTVE
jgi:hypothetical protein